MHMYILGMESSCDETSAAVVEMGNGVRAIRSNIVASAYQQPMNTPKQACPGTAVTARTGASYFSHSLYSSFFG